MREEVKKPADFQVAKDADNVIRDLKGKEADLDLIEKLQKSKLQANKVPLELRYDDKYLKEIFKEFAHKLIPISSMRLRDTYDHYSYSFRKYTEEKFYSGIKNLPNFI